jgi:hypothetical protein
VLTVKVPWWNDKVDRVWEQFEQVYPKEAREIRKAEFDGESTNLDMEVDKVELTDYFEAPLDAEDVARRCLRMVVAKASKSRGVIDQALGENMGEPRQVSHPHPGLHAIVKLRIYTRGKEAWAEFDHSDFNELDVTVPVPDHVPFEMIGGYMRARYTSEGPKQWWNSEIADQHPEFKAKVEASHKPHPGIGVVGVVDYVHKDGTPYDVRPLQADHLKRVMQKRISAGRPKVIHGRVVGESGLLRLGMNARQIIDAEIEHDPKPAYAFSNNAVVELDQVLRQPFTAYEYALRYNRHHPKLWQAVKGSPFEAGYRRRFNPKETVSPRPKAGLTPGNPIFAEG